MLFIFASAINALSFDLPSQAKYRATRESLYGPSVGSGYPFSNWPNYPHGDLGIVGHLREDDLLQKRFFHGPSIHNWYRD